MSELFLFVAILVIVLEISELVLVFTNNFETFCVTRLRKSKIFFP